MASHPAASDRPPVGRETFKPHPTAPSQVARVARSARCLVLAPDVRRSPAAHADPVELVTRVLADAHAAGVPVVFALSRRGMGQVFGCAKSMSIVALMPVGECLPELEAMLAEAAKASGVGGTPGTCVRCTTG